MCELLRPYGRRFSRVSYAVQRLSALEALHPRSYSRGFDCKDKSKRAITEKIQTMVKRFLFKKLSNRADSFDERGNVNFQGSHTENIPSTALKRKQEKESVEGNGLLCRASL